MQYHEPANELSKKTRDITRALVSLKEEIEAIDWYNQRMDCAEDQELKAILAHNRDEEIEHACMAMAWLQKNMDGWQENIKEYLFNNDAVAETPDEKEDNPADQNLSIGKIK